MLFRFKLSEHAMQYIKPFSSSYRNHAYTVTTVLYSWSHFGKNLFCSLPTVVTLQLGLFMEQSTLFASFGQISVFLPVKSCPKKVIGRLSDAERSFILGDMTSPKRKRKRTGLVTGAV